MKYDEMDSSMTYAMLVAEGRHGVAFLLRMVQPSVSLRIERNHG